MEEDDANGQSDLDMGFIGNFNVASHLGSLEPNFDDELSALLLNQMGDSGRSYRREASSAVKKIVSEI